MTRVKIAPDDKNGEDVALYIDDNFQASYEGLDLLTISKDNMCIIKSMIVLAVEKGKRIRSEEIKRLIG
jgi:hypothetical protein